MDRNESLTKFEAHLRRRFPERRTPVDYVSDVRQFMAICQKEWRDVTMQDIDAFVDQQRAKGLKGSTVNRRVAALKTFFDFLAEECDDLSWPNPVRFKRHAGKRPRSLPRDLRDEDLESVWSVIASKRDRAWFTLMVRSGACTTKSPSKTYRSAICSSKPSTSSTFWTNSPGGPSGWASRLSRAAMGT